jgi:hypothetical protein
MDKFCMDKLYQDTINKKYTDIEIILIDPTKNALSIHAHKCILGCTTDYFDSLFNLGKEKYQSVIEIKVDDICAARDLIMLFFYGQEINPLFFNDTKYLLQLFKCRRFFGLSNRSLVPARDVKLNVDVEFDVDVELLYNIDVLPEDFNLFMQVIDEFDFINDKHLIKTIKKNIPLNYDLNNFTPEFINEIVMHNDYLIVANDKNNTIKIWDLQTGKILNTLNGHDNWINSVAFSPDNSKIISSSSDRSIKIWDTQSGKLLNTLNGHTDSILCAIFSFDDLKIASGGHDYSVKIWNAQSCQLLNTLIGHTSIVYSVAFSLDNMKIASGSRDNSIKIWNAHSGQLLNTIVDHGYSIYSVSFSLDNTKIISGGTNGNIRIWDSESGILLKTLVGHTDWINNVIFSPNNSKIISCGFDGIKLWSHNDIFTKYDTQSYQTLNIDDIQCMHSISITSDGMKIISGNDMHIKIWDAHSGKLLNTLNDSNAPITKKTSVSNPIIYPIDIKLKEHIKNISTLRSSQEKT